MPNIHHLNRNGSRQSTSRREMLNSRASKIHSSQSLRYYKNNKRRGGGNSNNNNELSNSEKNLLLQEYKRERYLKKIKGLHTKLKVKKVVNRLHWGEVQRRQKLQRYVM